MEACTGGQTAANLLYEHSPVGNVQNWYKHAWSTVIPEKLTVSQLTKKIPTFYGTKMFIAVFTRICHLSLSWARLIQSTALYPITVKLILVLSFRLRAILLSCFFPPDFPHQTQLCTVVYVPHAPTVITLIMCGEKADNVFSSLLLYLPS